MTTTELIERGIGHNCLSDAYDLGRHDAEKELNALGECEYNKGARDFAEWICKYLGKDNMNSILYTYRQSPVGFIWQKLKTVDEILAEWQKGQKNV